MANCRLPHCFVVDVVVVVVEGERKNDFLAYSLEAGKNYCHSVK